MTGAGPVGPTAAAHLLERGLEPRVLEAGDDVGSAVRAWPHVMLFSPSQYDLDAAAVRLLEPTGWTSPESTGLPTGGDLVVPHLAPRRPSRHWRCASGPASASSPSTVSGWTRRTTTSAADRPFLVRTQASDGAVVDHRAQAVIDASGTGTVEPAGRRGAARDRRSGAGDHLSGPVPDVLGADRARFAGRRVLVVGAGHSATVFLPAVLRAPGCGPPSRPVTSSC